MNMRASLATLAVLVILLTGSMPAALQLGQAGNAERGRIAGIVTDTSGGVLPGATVVATAADGRVLGTAVTDGSGAYALTGVPTGAVMVTFQLEGFAEASAVVDVRAGEDARVSERLRLASLSETVVVHAPAPVEPARPRFTVPPPPAPLVARPLPEHDRAAVCGPAKPDLREQPLGTIKSRRFETQGGLYLAGTELEIDGGLEDGLLVGRNLVVRRHYHARGAKGSDVIAEHTAGVIQIAAASEHTSLAIVIYTCDALRKGDFLASFKPEPVRRPEPIGNPAYYDAARILFTDEGQTLGAPERMMVIDRGATQGVRIGQRFTLFREPGKRARPIPAGGATVIAVRADSATIRVERVSDAVMAGDWAAPQIPATASAGTDFRTSELRQIR